MTAVARVALTGGIATGKSYCLARFVELGAPAIDADQLARQAIAPGTPGFDAVLSRFGRAVQKRDGGLDRDALAGTSRPSSIRSCTRQSTSGSTG